MPCRVCVCSAQEEETPQRERESARETSSERALNMLKMLGEPSRSAKERCKQVESSTSNVSAMRWEERVYASGRVSLSERLYSAYAVVVVSCVEMSCERDLRERGFVEKILNRLTRWRWSLLVVVWRMCVTFIYFRFWRTERFIACTRWCLLMRLCWRTDGGTEWWCYANGMLGRGIDQQRDIRMRSKRKVLSSVFVGLVAEKMIGGR